MSTSLILGGRQTGKTTLILDTCLNQSTIFITPNYFMAKGLQEKVQRKLALDVDAVGYSANRNELVTTGGRNFLFHHDTDQLIGVDYSKYDKIVFEDVEHSIRLWSSLRAIQEYDIDVVVTATPIPIDIRGYYPSWFILGQLSPEPINVTRLRHNRELLDSMRYRRSAYSYNHWVTQVLGYILIKYGDEIILDETKMIR